MQMSSATSSPSLNSAVELLPEALIFGQSAGMRMVRWKIEEIATTSTPVLIVGESGTGKEVVARFLHSRSLTRAGPFLRVSCSGLRASSPQKNSLIDDDLVLVVPHSLAGVPEGTLGCGTLLLDEIALLDRELQARLVEMLQAKQLMRIGFAAKKRLDLRAVSTTARRLEQEVEAGRFDRELFSCFNGARIYLPPLRERLEDIAQFIDFFICRYNEKFQTRARPPSADTLRQLQGYSWPGNIRELENLVMRYVVLGSVETILAALGGTQPHDSPNVPVPQEGISLKKVTREATQELEGKIIRKVLEDHRWNRKEAARALNISYRALLYKIKEAGLPPKRGQVLVRPSEIVPEEKSDLDRGKDASA